MLEPGRRDNGRSRPRAVDNSDWPIPGPNAGLLDRNGGDGGPTRQTQRRRQEEEKESRHVLPKEWWEDVGPARDIASANDRLLSDLMMRVARLEQGAEETSRQIATAEAMATVSTTHDTPPPFFLFSQYIIQHCFACATLVRRIEQWAPSFHVPYQAGSALLLSTRDS